MKVKHLQKSNYYFQQMLSAMDKNADGKVSFKEFYDRLHFLSH